MGTYHEDIEVENEVSYFEINFKYRKNLQSIKKEYNRYFQFFKYNYDKHLPYNKNAKICDMACGIGETVNSLKWDGYTNVIGVDFDNENVQFCRKQGLNVVQGSIYEYFKDKKNEFDVIILNDIIEHIEKNRVIAVLKDIKASLCENGILIIKTVNAANPFLASASRYMDFTHEIIYDEFSIRDILLIAGFQARKIKIKESNLYVFWKNPLNYVAWLINSLINLFLRCYFILNFKKQRIFTKNLIAVVKK